jgi:predicted regulator of Ras-like GTPase activity (Roadblock/LC7/MglB family)
MDRMERIHSLLKRFNTSTPDIEGSAVISNDGLMIASLLSSDFEEERVGAMAAAMLSLGERSSQEMQRGDLEQAYVQGGNGYVILQRASSETLLLALTTKKAKLGLVFLDVGRLANSIREIL